MIMKKLFLCILLILIWCNIGFAQDIKIKRIECNYDNSEKRYDNYFFIISSDSDGAKLYTLSYRRKSKKTSSVIINDLSIYTDIYTIFFGRSGQPNKYILDRNSGILKSNYVFNGMAKEGFAKCSKMEEDFNPLKYLNNIVDEINKKQKKKNIF